MAISRWCSGWLATADQSPNRTRLVSPHVVLRAATDTRLWWSGLNGTDPSLPHYPCGRTDVRSRNGPPAAPPQRATMLLPPCPPGRHDAVLGRHLDPRETRQLLRRKGAGLLWCKTKARWPARPPTSLSLLDPRHPGDPIDTAVNADAGRVQFRGGHTRRIEHH